MNNNEEKVKEIAHNLITAQVQDDWWYPRAQQHYEEALMEMAQWKDEQFKEQKKLTWKEVKCIIELNGDIESDNFMGSDEYYQDIADKANVILFGLQGKLDDKY